MFLHELAHVMSISYGHTTEFYDNFRFLLEHSKNYNFIDYDYLHFSNYYCGINLEL